MSGVPLSLKIKLSNVAGFVSSEILSVVSAFSGSAFTLANIQYLMTKDNRMGESAFGSYFWCADMLILKEMTVECLGKAIKDILSDQSLDIEKIFTQVVNNP